MQEKQGKTAAEDTKLFKKIVPPIATVLFLVLADQLTKYLIVTNFSLHESKPLIPDVFHLTYIQNAGMAWGMFQGKRIAFLILTIPVLGLLGFVYANVLHQGKHFTPLKVLIVLIAAGAVGNMIDRIRLGYVVDFLDFCLINFPIFNVADIFVTMGMILALILLLFYYSPEDFEIMLEFKNARKKAQNKEREESGTKEQESPGTKEQEKF